MDALLNFDFCVLPFDFALLICPLPSTYSLLPSAYCLLPTAFCLQPTAFCLLLSANYVLRNALQNPGARAIRFQGLAGLFHQTGSDLLRGLDAMERGVSGLVLLFILANSLAQFGLRSQHIEQIIGNLKCQADLFPVSRNAGQVILGRPG